MPLRHDQDMRRRLGIDVVKGHDLIVLVNLLGVDLAADDAAEETAVVAHSAGDDTTTRGIAARSGMTASTR